MATRSRVSINGARGLFKVVCAALLLVPGSALAASFTGLGTLIGAVPGSRANAVSSDGLVVVGTAAALPNGTCVLTMSCTEAWKWTAASGMVRLGIPTAGTTSVAVDVSADGAAIVGHGLVSDSSELFRWQAASGFEIIDPPAPVYTDLGSGFQAVSGDGNVVLGYTRSEPPSPFPRDRSPHDERSGPGLRRGGFRPSWIPPFRPRSGR